MGNKYYSIKGKKISKKKIHSKKVKATRKRFNKKTKNKKKTRRLIGGIKHETVEKKRVLKELMPTFREESTYRAFTKIPIETIKNMTPDERNDVYTKWRKVEEKRRKELRELQKLNNIYTAIDAELEKPQVVGEKRSVSSKQPRDEFNTPFKKQARKVIDVDKVNAIRLFENEKDLYEEDKDYTEVKRDEPEPNINNIELNDDELDFVDDELVDIEYREK